MLIVAVLLATVVLRVAVVCWAVYLLLPRGPVCRRCDNEMIRLRNRLLDAWVPVLERRWCLACGWNGVVRRGPAPSPRPHAPAAAPPTWM
ncbi:MAG TPA: hypothetical protein VFX28_08610 [Methylomirabilota bacterium]|nr:hypothetical protein [Methylomirabilota bacterium]